jgi:hypothetical protein
MTHLGRNFLVLQVVLRAILPIRVDANHSDPGPWANDPLRETQPCVAFDTPAVQAALVTGPSNPWGFYDPECDTNNCPGGCCRAYSHVLVCDVRNDFSHLPVRTIHLKHCARRFIMSA